MKKFLSVATLILCGFGCASIAPPAPSPEPVVSPVPPTSDCTPRGTCRNGEACPRGTSCSGMPAFGCYPDGCPTPICLASDTMIATPAGNVPVTSLKRGDLVMTVDERGGQAVAPIIELGSTVAPPGHQLVRLILVDGRLLRVSPGHPTFDGRTVADLKVGTPYDGAIIASVDLEPYGGGHTFDILPAGPTGQYWANAIRMGSTLRK